MNLRFEREIAAPSSVVWCALCEPDRMNLWSQATVKLVSPGQSAHPGGPGTHRRVYIKAAGTTMRLDEVIRDSEPGRRLVYQVVDNPLLRSHRGTITLEEDDGHTVLSWDVEFTCTAPGLARIFAGVLRKQLESSLDALKRQLEESPQDGAPLPTWNPIPQPTPDDWKRAESVLVELETLAATLDGSGDIKSIFPHIYAYVCEGILDSCRSGGFVYPSWALHMMPVFYEYFSRNFQRWTGEAAGEVESHWKRAFCALDGLSNKHQDSASRLLGGLVLSVHAHVESDLPRTFAEVYVDNFATLCDYNRFRGDYYCMSQIFIDSFSRVQDLIPDSYLPAWAKLARRVLPREAMQELAYDKAYDLPKRRRAAFRRGAELAEMLLVRQHRRAAHETMPDSAAQHE